MPFVERNNKLEKEILKKDLKDPKLYAEYLRFKQEFDIKMSLVKARKHSNVSQTELADRTGLSQQAVSRIETSYCNTTLDTLLKYSLALGYTIKIVKCK